MGPKKLGCCLDCGRECFEVLDVQQDGPFEGHPTRLGCMRPEGCQVGFLLSDGTEADVTFCRACAGRLRPEHYQAVWEACLDRASLSYTATGRPRQERLLKLLPLARKWPVAMLYWRRENQETGGLVLARASEDA